MKLVKQVMPANPVADTNIRKDPFDVAFNIFMLSVLYLSLGFGVVIATQGIIAMGDYAKQFESVAPEVSLPSEETLFATDKFVKHDDYINDIGYLEGMSVTRNLFIGDDFNSTITMSSSTKIYGDLHVTGKIIVDNLPTNH